MRRNKGFITEAKTSYSLADNGAVGVHDTFDQYNARVDNKWPKVKKFVSCSPNSGSILEGNSQTFTITVDGYDNGKILYYTIESVTGAVNIPGEGPRPVIGETGDDISVMAVTAGNVFVRYRPVVEILLIVIII